MSDTWTTLDPPAQVVEPEENAPVRVVSPMALKGIATQLLRLFETYKSERRIAELKWMRNLRQYLGLYDPEIEAKLTADRSRAYPRLTRVKCISTLARVMNLMFPGNERNWSLTASPSAEMAPEDVMEAVQEALAKAAEAGAPADMTEDMVQDAANALAAKRAAKLAVQIDDYLQEIGGDQTLDYIALNRKVVSSGIRYGVGLLKGPMVRTVNHTTWGTDPMTGMPVATTHTSYKPQFDFLSVWDFYPDMSAKDLSSSDGDGWFERLVMTRAQLRALANRPDFFGDIIKAYLQRTPTGNYKAQTYEQELRSLGVSSNINENRAESQKYEVIVWHGPISGQMLREAGADVPEDKLADDIEAEVWLTGDVVIKADVNAWRKIGASMRSVHAFIFDEDDSSPLGNGLPAVIRDSQMSMSAATRMLLDNAGVVCGPNLEVNSTLLRADQDITSIYAYKVWEREDDGPTAQWPAVRQVPIDGHLNDLIQVINLFMAFADSESFVNPQNGGDVQRGSGEPMRTAAGASMLRGEAALPFKDIIRNFDTFTQSVISSVVLFAKKFNPSDATQGDFNVIGRGASSLIAKEIRGVQVDSLVATLTPEEMDHVDDRKLVEARFAVRDMTDILVPPDEARRRKQARQAKMAEMEEMQKQTVQAEVRKTLADAFKGITQGQKNAAAADSTSVKAATDALNMLAAGTEGDDGDEDDAPAPKGGQANGAAR
jgi:hypothetical protein